MTAVVLYYPCAICHFERSEKSAFACGVSFARSTGAIGRFSRITDHESWVTFL
jgi:hypothetical protein